MRIFGRRSELPHNLGEILSFAVLGFGSRGFLLCSFPKELGQGRLRLGLDVDVGACVAAREESERGDTFL
jgi:hypothetical protein